VDLARADRIPASIAIATAIDVVMYQRVYGFPIQTRTHPPAYSMIPDDGDAGVLLELTSEPITRALRKAVAASLTRMEASHPTLSRIERNERLRRAPYVA
jgi:hypothetical protein